jgi:hypothetical protein
MVMLIISRTVQGIGGGGLSILVTICISDTFSMRFANNAHNSRAELSTDRSQGATSLFWHHWNDLGICERHWSTAGRSSHRESILEVVLLYQP